LPQIWRQKHDQIQVKKPLGIRVFSSNFAVFRKKSSTMPNIKSAAKRMRQTAKARLRNRTRMVTARNLMKKVRKMTDAKEAAAMIPQLNSQLDRLANRNIIHKRTAANYKARITRYVNKLAS
jgi:small subunit ribosomal protein S20